MDEKDISGRQSHPQNTFISHRVLVVSLTSVPKSPGVANHHAPRLLLKSFDLCGKVAVNSTCAYGILGNS
jgi:hypothetical protein